MDFFIVFAILYCLFLAACWEKADLLALLYVMLFVFCHCPIRCPLSGVVLDCIDS